MTTGGHRRDPQRTEEKNGTGEIAGARRKERVQRGAAESDRMEHLPRGRRQGPQGEKGNPGRNNRFNRCPHVVICPLWTGRDRPRIAPLAPADLANLIARTPRRMKIVSIWAPDFCRWRHSVEKPGNIFPLCGTFASREWIARRASPASGQGQYVPEAKPRNILPLCGKRPGAAQKKDAALKRRPGRIRGGKPIRPWEPCRS